MRFAMSLGMLLGMAHGWISSDHTPIAAQQELELINTVKSDTHFFPGRSQAFGYFPY